MADRTSAIEPGHVLAVAVVRDEMARLPHWIAHHRRLGVGHFLIVDNASVDGSREWLAAEPDVSLWTTPASYRAARFGMDWANRLLARYGNGHWCLTIDADETLIYPHWDSRDLHALTSWLDAEGLPGLACLMLEPYPDGPVGATVSAPGQDPLSALGWFDPDGYRLRRQGRFGAVLAQGGPRDRLLYRHDPDASPTVSKIPLMRWRRGQAYVVSTHFALPTRLNEALERILGNGGPSGVLLHAKLMPDLARRSREAQARGQHFTHPKRHGAYYEALTAGPDFRHAGSARLDGWRQLEALGLMDRGGWD